LLTGTIKWKEKLSVYLKNGTRKIRKEEDAEYAPLW